MLLMPRVEKGVYTPFVRTRKGCLLFSLENRDNLYLICKIRVLPPEHFVKSS
jgi:hypothetical protein